MQSGAHWARSSLASAASQRCLSKARVPVMYSAYACASSAVLASPRCEARSDSSSALCAALLSRRICSQAPHHRLQATRMTRAEHWQTSMPKVTTTPLQAPDGRGGDQIEIRLPSPCAGACS